MIGTGSIGIRAGDPDGAPEGLTGRVARLGVGPGRSELVLIQHKRCAGHARMSAEILNRTGTRGDRAASSVPAKGLC